MRIDLLGNWVGRAPVAIGGVGGSGTRIVARMVSDLGWYLGDDLNEPNDALLFTLLFKHRSILEVSDQRFAELYNHFRKRMRNGEPMQLGPRLINALLSADRAQQHDVPWLLDRLDRAYQPGRRHLRWGWKEPNTHMVLNRIIPLEPKLKYIHVVRSGLYMAKSRNQNQLRLWGPVILRGAYNDSPRSSFLFWIWAQRRALELGERMGANFLLIDYDELANDPKAQIARLFQFLEVQSDENKIAKFAGTIESRDRNDSAATELRRMPLSAQDRNFVAEHFPKVFAQLENA